MKKNVFPLLLCLLFAWITAGMADSEPPRVGIYCRPSPDMNLVMLGSEGLMFAFEEEYDGDAVFVEDFDPETLKDIDVLILSCVYGYPKEWGEDKVKARIRKFVKDGKGAILINESIGWRRAFSKNPMFSEFGHGTGKGTGYANTVTAGVGPDTVKNVPLKIVKPGHPVMKDVSGTFEASNDMPEIIPGPKGVPLVKWKEKDVAAVVVGELGKGRVVLIGPHIGLGRRIMETPPEGNLLQLILNSVAWAGSGK